MPTGDLAAIACALGGERGDTLFVCVAPDANPESRRGAGEAAVLATKVTVPGARRPDQAAQPLWPASR